MDSSRPHKQLDVWNVSVTFVSEIYRVTAEFPSEEKYGLTSQLRRAAVSVPSNISEGAARDSNSEFVRFLHMASGSLSEVDTLLVLSNNLEIMPDDVFERLSETLDRIAALLSGLINHLKDSSES